MNSNIKAIAEKYANKVWNDKDTTTVDKLVHQDVVIHSLLGDFHGTKAMKDVVQAWLKGFPDLIVENNLVISENDIVSIQWRAKGTGKTVSYSGVTVYRIKNSQIIEYWAYLDMQHLLSQIE
jgi:predicted ester cyclase